MSPIASLRASVAAVVARHGRRRLDVAYSGGPDSTALADAAIAIVGADAVRLVHVDHGTPHSAAAVAHARRYAASVGARLQVVAITVPPGASWEAHARVAREGALIAAAEGELCATGHTASDQAETVLMRVIRGTGPDGLAAIARRKGLLVRPLLDHTRAEVAAYLVARQLTAWHDPMNDDRRLTRAWLRHEIVPALAARNPQVERALAALAARAADDRAFLDAAATTGRRSVERDDGGLDAAGVAGLAPAVARRVVAGWLAEHGRTTEGDAVAAVVALARAPAAGTRGVDLAGGRVERIYDRVVVSEGAPVAAPLVVLGPDGPYQVRAWAAGDRMRPARLRGASRKLSDLFGDAKVPRAWRAGARVVVDAAGAIVWAEHVGPAWRSTVVVRPADPPE